VGRRPGRLLSDAGARCTSLGRVGPSTLAAPLLAAALGAVRALSRRLSRGLSRRVLQRVPHPFRAQLGVSRGGRAAAGLAPGLADSRQGSVEPLVAPSARPMGRALQVRARTPGAAPDEASPCRARCRGRSRLGPLRRQGPGGSGSRHPRAFYRALHRSHDGRGCLRERGLCVRSAPLDEHGRAPAHGELDPADRAGASALIRGVQDPNRGALDVGRESGQAAPEESASVCAKVFGEVHAA
jgi:hypothetical protein